MFDPWVIAEIERLRRERELEDRRPGLQVELPVEPPQEPPRGPQAPRPPRTVIVIDYE
jgi:hypothetical protein